MKIVQDWRSQQPPGRFLKLNDRTKLWDDIGDDAAKDKVSTAFANKSKVKSRTDAQSAEEAGDRNYFGQTVQKKRTQIAKTTSQYQKHLDDELSDDESKILPKRATTKRGKAIKSSIPRDDGEDDSSEDEQWKGGDGDEDPWLGCVCGNTHPHPIKVFWIQCEGCDAWYNVAEECVGFDANAAEQLDEWRCWACDPPVAGLGL